MRKPERTCHNIAFEKANRLSLDCLRSNYEACFAEIVFGEMPTAIVCKAN